MGGGEGKREREKEKEHVEEERGVREVEKARLELLKFEASERYRSKKPGLEEDEKKNGDMKGDGRTYK